MLKRYLQTVCETTFSGDDELSLSSSKQGSFAVNQLPIKPYSSKNYQTSPSNVQGNLCFEIQQAEQYQQQSKKYQPVYNNAVIEEFFPGMAKYGAASSSLPSIENIFMKADSSALNKVVPINNTCNPAPTQLKSNNPIEGWYKACKYFLNFLILYTIFINITRINLFILCCFLRLHDFTTKRQSST